MAFYSREAIEKVRSANDIVDVISSYVDLQKKGSRHFGLCPFHNEKTGSFCVSQSNQLYYCFGCHESGNVVTFLMKHENMEFPEAIETLAQRAGIEIQSETNTGDSKEYRKHRDELFAVNKAAAEYYYRMLRDPEGERGLQFFKERRLNPKIMNAFGLGYTGPGSGSLHKYLKEQGFSDQIQKDAGLIVFDEKTGARDRFFNRVMFPIMDANRRVIAFGARVMGDAKPKYLNSSESDIFKKKENLYGLFAAKKSKRSGLILCEGYMDVISAHMAGFDNAVATLGTAFTEEHAKYVSRFSKSVYLCYDFDEAGEKATIKAYNALKRAGVSTKIIDLSPFNDPDDFIQERGSEEFEKRIEKADNALVTIKKWEYKKIDKDNPDENAEFLHGLFKNIAEYKDEAIRESYIKRLSREFNVDEGVLRRGVNETGNINYAIIQKTFSKQNRHGINPRDALRENEARLLYYLTDKDYYRKCKGIIERDDFTEDLFKEIYDTITEDIENSRKTEPCDIINIPVDESERKILSECFYKIAEEEERVGSASLKRSVLERVKKASLKRQDIDRDPSDTKALQKAMEISKEILDEIAKIKFE